VLDVGASPMGQASCSTPISRLAWESRASCESSLPAMLTSAAPRRLISGSMVTSSPVLPELEMAITTSSPVIIPRSPWLASPGCTKKAGVPVLARVAAILLPIWPDFPIPVTTTTRPGIRGSAGRRGQSCHRSSGSSASMASRSMVMVRRADSSSEAVFSIEILKVPMARVGLLPV